MSNPWPHETWQERIERDIVEGKAVTRGEHRKAAEEEAATPELCLSWHPDLDVACLMPKGHAGGHSNAGTRWHE